MSQALNQPNNLEGVCAECGQPIPLGSELLCHDCFLYHSTNADLDDDSDAEEYDDD